MWHCSKCGEDIDDNFDVCWNCGTSRDGTQDPAFRRDGEAPSSGDVTLTCLRCRHALQFVGAKDLHEGHRWGVLGDLGELFVQKERFDMYVCPQCRHVEFFVAGIGDELRLS